MLDAWGFGRLLFSDDVRDLSDDLLTIAGHWYVSQNGPLERFDRTQNDTYRGDFKAKADELLRLLGQELRDTWVADLSETSSALGIEGPVGGL